jgi:hypothetical protein
MEKTKRRLGGFDKWSTWMLIALSVVGALLILVDAVLIAGILMQSRGILPSGWFAQPTPVVVPTIQIAPAEGVPGVTIAVAGQGWRANEPLVVELADPTGVCSTEVVAGPNAGPDGRFRDTFAFPSAGCWAGLSRALVTARSLGTESKATAEFRLSALPQTPTPTVTWTPVIEPTAVVTSTPVTEPTATPVAEPTFTATPTPVVAPTSTPTPVTWPTATPTPAIVDWRGEYFENAGLTGMARVVRNDKAIDFDWGYNAPATGLPGDGFSARWTRALNFEDGLYRFRAVVDDGIRLYVDGDLVIDQWRDGGRREVTADRRLTAGRHTLRVEYYERSGVAVAQVRWEKVASYSDWKGEYWPNLNLQGNPAIVRNDPGPNGTLGIDFNWKQGSPGSGIPADGFSARWTRKAALDAGTYRFHVLVDDGVRLWLNDRLIVDAWADHNAQEFVTDWTLAKGTYTLKVEYYERIGSARIRVWWEKVASPTYPDWRGEYWPNRTLSGEFTLLRNDREINFNWGSGAPAPSLPVDSFSARWTRQAHFDAAVYRFHTLADDGIRLWVDGQLLIDKWQDQHLTEFTADRTMVRGTHGVKVEYYEHTGGARVKVWWDKVAGSYPDWKGEYWPNRDLSGSPGLVRNDKAIDFNWGTGAPATGLPADNLSARWTRQVTFQPGVYRFNAWADDGVRAALDGRWIINEWHDARNEVYSTDLSLNGTTHQVTVEYYERGGNAGVRFWWKRIGDLPPVTIPKAQFSSAVYTVDEGSGTATITVLLSAVSDRTVTVDYATSGGTAAPGSDYGAASGTLTFNPGVTSRTFSVGIVDDTVDETDETVVLTLSNPVNAQLGTTYQAILTIVDNDAPPPSPEVRFSAATYSVDEGAGAATITVILSATSDRTLTVDYAASAGTASAGSDYVVTNGTLTFNPGATSRTFSVSIIDDTADEADETVALVLSNPVHAQLGTPHQAALIIVDNDEPAPPPEVRFSAATYSVDEGAGAATITIILSATSDRTVTVDYAASDGTASAGSDYVVTNGTLTFNPGVTSQTFAVNIVDDVADEADETVALTLSSPTLALLGAPFQAVLAIIDDDIPPPVSSSVRLNEILPLPGGTDWDKDGTADELDEWIELYNAGTAPLDLSGWLLDDAEDGSAPYQIPTGTALEPGAFLVLYRQTTGIILDDGGDTVRLLDPSGQVVDAVTFGEVGADASYNRSESGSWYVDPLPSPGAPNAVPMP